MGKISCLDVDSPPVRPCIFKAGKLILGATTDPAVVEENEGKLAKVLDVYEARLSQ
ncbi:hypothetical protein CCACVL1_16006 [Corchorus capsularis]|uniref:Uncharacterized protein n=1 Tax=Corchorus capsularis TaxID=210143 RepID=A0A1R3HZV6_COCAP|nr:hypothetical protein CCACVL1_16006 [Corchorus capsularis]